MSNSLLLDPVGDALLPSGYKRISTEAAWLRLAKELPANEQDPPLVVVAGSELCAWAERWWRGRGGDCLTLRSSTEHLLAVCPTLSLPYARIVLSDLGSSWAARPAPWLLPEILDSLYPDFNQRHEIDAGWFAQPTTSQARATLAAQWLLWVADRAQPWPAHHVPLLVQQMENWSNADATFHFPVDSDTANALLQVWLGLAPTAIGQANPAQTFGTFPASVPPIYLTQARNLHAQQLTDLNQTHLTTEELFQRLNAWWKERNKLTTAVAIRELAAAQYADFLLVHQHLLRVEHLRELLPQLGSAPQAQLLRDALPPAEPADLSITATPKDTLNWATTEYLPYRSWQSNLPATQMLPRERVVALATQFENWVLQNYPALLVGPNRGLLHIHQAEELRFARSKDVTLWVVPDGLGWLDALTLGEYIHSASAGVLTAPQATACMGLLPTITSLTKQPLLHSTTARALPNAQPNTKRTERYIAGHLNPADYLRDAQPGDLFIWTPPDPDSAYHGQFDRKTIQKRVGNLLLVLAQQLADAAQKVPTSLNFRLVVSTDHGRQLGNSDRNVVIPNGFESHGRAAYPANNNNQLVPVAAEKSRADLAWLEPEAFGLPHWAAVVRGDAAFRTNNTDAGGQLQFPHGGLWPEEVVVPWLVMERASPALPLTARLTGHGLARHQGQAMLAIVNPTSLAYTLISLELNSPDGFIVSVPLTGQVLPAMASHDVMLSLATWPTPSQAAELSIQLALTDDEGRQFAHFDFFAQITSEDFEEAADLDLNF